VWRLPQHADGLVTVPWGHQLWVASHTKHLHASPHEVERRRADIEFASNIEGQHARWNMKGLVLGAGTLCSMARPDIVRGAR
jgi:hypothetical protein